MTRYNWFNGFGTYLGYVGDDGAFFDKDGHKWARVDESSKVFDPDGCYVGHIDGQGNFFADQARWLGYLRDWSRTWDQHGSGSSPVSSSANGGG